MAEESGLDIDWDAEVDYPTFCVHCGWSRADFEGTACLVKPSSHEWADQFVLFSRGVLPKILRPDSPYSC